MSSSVAAVLVISGVLSAGYAVAALFFARFYRDTRDRLFLYFAVAFGLLAVQRVTLAWASHNGDATLVYYIVRLAAFLIILAAIVDKNRPRAR
jgi:membrane-associated PAP2 superfamily phosphatase